MPQQLANDLAFQRAHMLAMHEVRAPTKMVYIDDCSPNELSIMTAVEICDEPCVKCVRTLMRVIWPKPERHSREPSEPPAQTS